MSISYTRNYGDYGEENQDFGHVEKALSQLGATGADRFEAVSSFVSQEKGGYDNMAVLFIAPDSGRSWAWSGTGEHSTIFYYQWDNTIANLLNIDDTPEVVYAHELGHLFGGEDEYYEEGNTAYGEVSGAPSEPMQRLYPSFNYESGPSPEESIMATYGVWDTLGWFNISTPPSSWATGMFGWRDFDGDGTLDAFDETIPVRFPKNRAPILGASIDTGTQVKYTNFDDVGVSATYDDTEAIDSASFKLQTPAGRTEDSTSTDPTNFVSETANLQAQVTDEEKPGNWTIQYFYGNQLAAWYELEVIAPLVSLGSDSLDFGRVNVDSTGSASVQIKNDGKMQASISDISASSEEDVGDTASSTVVDALSSLTYQVSLSPNDVGTITGSLSFDTNDPRNPSISVPFSGFAYALRHLQLSGPTTKKVDEQADFTVSYQEGGSPSSYTVTVTRDGTTVTDREFVDIQKAAGEAALSFGKYGDYAVTVDKTDTQQYEYRTDSASITIERLQEQVQLSLSADQTTVKVEESVEFTAEANGEPISAELVVDGESQGTGQTFTVTFEEPGSHSIRLRKDTERTDRVIRQYSDDSMTIGVEEQSAVGKATQLGKEGIDGASKAATDAAKTVSSAVKNNFPNIVGLILAVLAIVSIIFGLRRYSSDKLSRMEHSQEGSTQRAESTQEQESSNGESDDAQQRADPNYCTKCGDKLQAGSNYCTTCGNEI